jgi:hypothetical protein
VAAEFAVPDNTSVAELGQEFQEVEEGEAVAAKEVAASS